MLAGGEIQLIEKNRVTNLPFCNHHSKIEHSEKDQQIIQQRGFKWEIRYVQNLKLSLYKSLSNMNSEEVYIQYRHRTASCITLPPAKGDQVPLSKRPQESHITHTVIQPRLNHLCLSTRKQQRNPLLNRYMLWIAGFLPSEMPMAWNQRKDEQLLQTKWDPENKITAWNRCY